MGLSGLIGSGAADSLEKIIAQRFKETLERNRQADEARRLAQARRTSDQQYDIGRGNLDTRAGELGLAQQKFTTEQNQTASDRAAAESLLAGEGVPDDVRLAGRLGLHGVDLPAGIFTQKPDLVAVRNPDGSMTYRQKTEGLTSAPDVNMGWIDQGDGTKRYGTLTAGTISRDSGESGGGTDEFARAYQLEREYRNLQSVDELLPQVSWKTVGPAAMVNGVYGTDARYFKSQLDTLLSNIGYGELTAMRAASKTGGALGQVSELENRLLQRALGAIDQGIQPEQLKAQLTKVRNNILRWRATVDASRSLGAGYTVDQLYAERDKLLIEQLGQEQAAAIVGDGSAQNLATDPARAGGAGPASGSIRRPEGLQSDPAGLFGGP